MLKSGTNAQTMDEKISRQLIGAGLDELFISLDGAGEKIYKKLRVGLDL